LLEDGNEQSRESLHLRRLLGNHIRISGSIGRVHYSTDRQQLCQFGAYESAT